MITSTIVPFLLLCSSALAWRSPVTSRKSQSQTNGLSTWGTKKSPALPQFLNGPIQGGYDKPWGGRTCSNTNPYHSDQIPNTGVTRRYDFNVQNMTLAPDGVEVPMLVVNGQYPGPLVEANWGDWIEVHVTNNLENEGTSIHWHGFLQKGTPWDDGVAGVTQCPIPPGGSYTYRFRAELYGTSWWHSHTSSQYISGLVGPIVVHGPKSDAYDIDLGPVMLTDWYHDYYFNLVQQVFIASDVGPIFPPAAQNMLIQGKAEYPCGNTTLTCSKANNAQFEFKSGKKHLLRLINHSAEAIIFFSIDNHNITVVANDFVAVEPYQTDLVTLGVGQRTDIIVEGTGSPNSTAWLRIDEGPSGLGPPRGSTGCSLNDGIKPYAKALITYERSRNATTATTITSISPSRFLFPQNCANQPLTVTTPIPAIPVKDADITLSFIMTGGLNSTGQFVWWMNNRTFFADWNDPLLLEAKLGASTFPPQRATYDLGNATSVRLNITSIGFPASHPMHIHGHNMQILAEGNGYWNGTIVNPQNPQRRDTQLMRPAGYLVVQWDLDNPGLWLFHCHIAWHISEGNGIGLLERAADLRKLSFPGTVAQTCRDWTAYSNVNLVKQIDSGL